MNDKHPPKHLQGVLWSHNVLDLDIETDKHYIVNQLLQYGTLDELRWLFKTYTKKTVQQVFIHQPAKIFSPASFHFVKQYLLQLSKETVSTDLYVQNTPRNIQS